VCKEQQKQQQKQQEQKQKQRRSAEASGTHHLFKDKIAGRTTLGPQSK
jgi:hypothetical protein